MVLVGKVDSTLIVLREMRGIRTDLRDNSARLTELEERVDDLRRYVPEVELRLATAIAVLGRTICRTM